VDNSFREEKKISTVRSIKMFPNFYDNFYDVNTLALGNFTTSDLCCVTLLSRDKISLTLDYDTYNTAH
jgi:hypothetical protein